MVWGRRFSEKLEVLAKVKRKIARVFDPVQRNGRKECLVRFLVAEGKTWVATETRLKRDWNRKETGT